MHPSTAIAKTCLLWRWKRKHASVSPWKTDAWVYLIKLWHVSPRPKIHSVNIKHNTAPTANHFIWWHHVRVGREKERESHAHRLLPSAGEEKKPREDEQRTHEWEKWRKTIESEKMNDSHLTGIILTISKPPNPHLTVSCSSKHMGEFMHACTVCVDKSYTTHSYQTPAYKNTF